VTATRLAHRFITTFPEVLEPNVLYISLDYDTTVHLCACGCDNQVLLPLHPAAWRLTYDGETVSMSPSVGNWSFPCGSHYWIEHGRIRWAVAWTDAQVTAGRHRTLLERANAHLRTDTPALTPPRRPWWRRAARAVLARRSTLQRR
jgi:hypothetical protein